MKGCGGVLIQEHMTEARVEAGVAAHDAAWLKGTQAKSTGGFPFLRRGSRPVKAFVVKPKFWSTAVTGLFFERGWGLFICDLNGLCSALGIGMLKLKALSKVSP